MAGPPWLAVAVFGDTNGVAADAVENTFAFNAGSIADVHAAVNDFYVGTAGQSAALSRYLANTISRTLPATSINIYDISGHLDGSPHGSPVNVAAFTGLAIPGTAGDLPRQVAATLAYRGAGIGTVLEHGPTVSRPTDEAAQDEGAPATHPAKTRPKSSHRGRIRFGPLTVTALDAPGVVSTALITDLSVAAHRLLTGTGAGVTTNPGWSVWSRVLGSLDLITGGWVDVEFGVVRRRKNKTAVHVPWA